MDTGGLWTPLRVFRILYRLATILQWAVFAVTLSRLYKKNVLGRGGFKRSRDRDRDGTSSRSLSSDEPQSRSSGSNNKAATTTDKLVQSARISSFLTLMHVVYVDSNAEVLLFSSLHGWIGCLGHFI